MSADSVQKHCLNALKNSDTSTPELKEKRLVTDGQEPELCRDCGKAPGTCFAPRLRWMPWPILLRGRLWLIE
jgi:hypothetical protein